MFEHESDASILAREPAVRRRFILALLFMIGTSTLAVWVHWKAIDTSLEPLFVVAGSISQLALIYFGRQYNRIRVLKIIRRVAPFTNRPQIDLPLNKSNP